MNDRVKLLCEELRQSIRVRQSIKYYYDTDHYMLCVQNKEKTIVASYLSGVDRKGAFYFPFNKYNLSIRLLSSGDRIVF